MENRLYRNAHSPTHSLNDASDDSHLDSSPVAASSPMSKASATSQAPSQTQLGFQEILGLLPAETPVVFFEHLMRKLEAHTAAQASARTIETVDSASARAHFGVAQVGRVENSLGHSAMDPKDQWLCYLGLRLMHAESLKSRFERDVVALRATWNVIEPLLREAGLLFASKKDPDSNPEVQDMLARFLANEPPLIQTLPRHQARALTRKRASQRRRQMVKSFELQNSRDLVSM